MFGQYGECSDDVYDLLNYAATVMARRVWRRYGSRSMMECRAGIIRIFRRRLGCLVTREMARHRAHRVPYVGVPSEALVAAQRRAREGGRELVEPMLRPDDLYALQAHHARGAGEQ